MSIKTNPPLTLSIKKHVPTLKIEGINLSDPIKAAKPIIKRARLENFAPITKKIWN